jgi:hypothetical protein
MKKIIGLCLIATVITFTATAQASKFNFSIGGNVSSLSVLGASASGFGLDLVAKTDISPTIEGFAQTGYSIFSDNGTSLKYMPLLIGINFKTGNLRPGIGFGYGSFTYPDNWGDDDPYYGSGSYRARDVTAGGFSISPQLGINFEKIDLVASYTLNQIVQAPYQIKYALLYPYL